MKDSSDSDSVCSSSYSISSVSVSSSSESLDNFEGQTSLSVKHPISPGLSKLTFQALKRKALRLSPKDRICALLLHEIDLQPHVKYWDRDDFFMGFEDFGSGERNRKMADTAAVFMLRSVFGTWKQPVAFIFFDWPLKRQIVVRFLKEISIETRAAGLNLVSVVCNDADYNVSALEVLEIETNDQNHLEDGVLIVGGQEIVPIFDPCTLLVDIRNNLAQGDVLFEKEGVKKVAKWKYIQEAFEIDRALTQHLNKLTEHHVIPEKMNKGSVTTSIQVFSSTLSGFLKTIAGKTSDKTSRSLPLEAIETAEFVAFMDRIFDSVNGSSKESSTDKPLRGLVTEESPHSKVWLEGKQIFSSMRMCEEDPEFAVKSFSVWARSLDGFQLLKKKLAKLGYSSFPARSFNLDPLENCFDLMREWVKKRKNPSLTCTRFSLFYNMALESRDVSGCHASEGNCEEDGLSFLVSTRDFPKKKK